jgi:thioredoxin-related protein
MFDRRQFGKALLAAGTVFVPVLRAHAAERYQPQITDDGLYTQPWFMQTFLNLPDDLEESTKAGKRFAIIWEQKGCPYCREMHQVNFARPQINDYVRKNFDIEQLNIWGSRQVTDFDGQTLEERKLASKYRVVFTPTIQFFAETFDKKAGKSAADLEVARMPGYFKPFHFISMFEFVHDKAYEHTTFQRYLQEKLAKLKAKGIEPDVW